ncbi:MAG: TolC family protein, partial [Muribaculaceae bacterium]|nr:TolC family protein [Muribaculaceae bacterium]
MKLKNIILTLAVCATATSATGAGFEALVDNIIDNSPGLKATRLRMEQEIETLKGENMLPDPEIEFERLWRSGEGDNRWSAGISQEIEWPGTYSARRKAITALTRAGEAAMSAAEIEERTKASQIIIGIIAVSCYHMSAPPTGRNGGWGG